MSDSEEGGCGCMIIVALLCAICFLLGRGCAQPVVIQPLVQSVSPERN